MNSVLADGACSMKKTMLDDRQTDALAELINIAFGTHGGQTVRYFRSSASVFWMCHMIAYPSHARPGR